MYCQSFLYPRVGTDRLSYEVNLQMATTSDEIISFNPFARTLLFYYLHQRAKLTSTDLEKIAKKYALNGEKLIGDLVQKYSSIIPEYVHMSELRRICSSFTIPATYITKLNLPDSDTSYCKEMDIYHANFDPLTALDAVAGTTLSHIRAPRLDNIFKVRHLLPVHSSEYAAPGSGQNAQSNMVAAVLPKSNCSDGAGIVHNDDNTTTNDTGPIVVPTAAVKSSHLFDVIAEAALLHQPWGLNNNNSNNNNTSSSNSESTAAAVGVQSPLALLHQCMKQRIRVRIIVRRHGRLVYAMYSS